jgi:hypothetical protein
VVNARSNQAEVVISRASWQTLTDRFFYRVDKKTICVVPVWHDAQLPEKQ